MKARFRCSNCQGTFDSPTADLAPACPLGAGTMKIIAQATDALPGTPTGCLSSSLDVVKRSEFLNGGVLRIDHYVPSTGRGKFDCAYSPRQSVLDVTIKFQMNFVTEKGEAPFTPEEQTRLQQALRDGVPRYWNDKCTLTCVRGGWTNIVARPRFRVLFTDAPQAHFRMLISRPPAEAALLPSELRDCRGFVSIRQVTDGPASQDTAQLRDYHLQDFSHTLGASSIAGNERKRIAKLVDDAGLGLITFADDSDALPTATQSSLNLLAARIKQRVGGTHLVPLVITPISASAEPTASALATRRGETVRAFLAARAIGNPLVVKARTGGAAPGVSFAPDPSFEDDPLQRATLDYNTAAHEFGHMIGLPDEYENPEEGANAKADPGNTAKAIVKRNFLALTQRARVSAPTFPSHTVSMMSDGMTVMAWHYVTVWEALGTLTKDYLAPSDWVITMS
jgi:hypothetical protein